MKKIAVAGFHHETNIFSPIPTTYADFTRGGINAPGLLMGDEIRYFEQHEMNNATSGFMRAAAGLGMQTIPVIWTEAEPSDKMSRETFEKIMELLVDGLQSNGPFDGVFLDLHGAMIIGDFQDGETEIIKKVRQVVGNLPVVVALDLHANISPQSFDLASAMIAYRTYPHVDIYQTGERCASILNGLLDNIPICKSYKHLPFIIPTSSQGTDQEPCRSIFGRLDQLESREDILSVSVALGFPPGDIEHMGPAILVYGTHQEATDEVLEELYGTFLRHEKQFHSKLVAVEAAIERAMQSAQKLDRPVILADVQDNPGGGSGSDSVWILEHLLERGVQDAAIALVFDPAVAEAAHTSGEGTTITIDLGGKMLPGHRPFHGTFEVVKIFDGDFEATGPMAKGMVINLGKLALLKIDGIYISVSSTRVQAADQAVFTLFGLDPTKMEILVLKSFIHYRAAFESIAGEIINVEAPGAEFDDPSKVQYRNLRDGVRLGGCGPVLSKQT